jgi:TPR repeat protein
MEDQIKKFIQNHNNTYFLIEDKSSIKKIYDLLINNIIYEPENIIENYYLGLYYDQIKKNYDLAKKYYLVAVNNGNITAMNKLARCYEKLKIYDLMKKYYLLAIDNKDVDSIHILAYYYDTIEKNYELAKKYYLISITHNKSNSMHNLGIYYESIKNYDLMKKYYLMAIDNGETDSACNLGNYYKNIEKNYDLMKKYYLMAIDNNDSQSMNNLANYYRNIEKNYDLMKKYYLMAIDNHNIISLNNLINYYKINDLLIEKLEFFTKYINKVEREVIIDLINQIAKTNLNKEDNKKFIDIIINFEFEDTDKIYPVIKILIETIKYKISITKLHFEYSLEGKGFKEAEEDFYNKII